MKRIICLLLCIMSIVACCSLTISAASEEASPSIMSELSNMTIGGKQFDEADYPVSSVDSNKYIISVVEKGFKNIGNSPDYALYLYVYNPNCEKIERTNENSVQIGVNLHEGNYYYYGLTLMSVSSDNRFLKFKVKARGNVGVDTLYMMQDAANERVYNIVTLRLYSKGSLAAYGVKKSFLFTGYDFDDTLACEKKDLYALDVEMYSTNWISPNSGAPLATISDHYEINSVYFTLPKSLFEDGTGYDYIESIRADFMKYEMTPIIVTRPGDIDSITKSAITEGTIVDPGSDVDVMDLMWSRDGISALGGPKGYYYYYTASKYLDSVCDKSVSTRYNCLAYYFENADLPEDYQWDYGTVKQLAVSAEELESYFYERYNDPSYDNGKLYNSETHLVVDYNSADFGEDYLYNMRTFMCGKSDLDRWFYQTWYKDDSYLFEDFNVACNKIDVINPADYASGLSSDNYREKADELFISENDMKHFSSICKQAVENDEYVVLLRFGFSYYWCSQVYDANKAGVGYVGPVGFAIQKTFYRSVSLIHIVFSKNGESVVVPVCSNTVDSFGDLYVYEDPTDKHPLIPDDKEDSFSEFWRKTIEFLKKVLKILLIVFLIPLLLPIIYFAMKLFLRLIKAISKLFKKTSSENTGNDVHSNKNE